MRQHIGFCGQHIQVVAQAGPIALHGNLVRAFCRVLRGALLDLLARNGLHGRDLVGHVAHGVKHGGVIAFNCSIQVCGFAAQVGAQAARIKNRQAQGRANAPLLAARPGQVVQANAGETGKCDEVDVGIELGLGIGHVLDGGFDAPAGGRDVGPSAQQVCRDRGHGSRHRYVFNS